VHRRNTPGEYRKSIEKDRSLERRFQAVKVPPPNEVDAIRIIHGSKDRYEKFHAVSYYDAAMRVAVSHSNRYIPDRFLPDKAIDLIDEAGARVKLRQTSLPEEITEVQKRIKFTRAPHGFGELPIMSLRRRVSTSRAKKTQGARGRTCAPCATSITLMTPLPALWAAKT